MMEYLKWLLKKLNFPLLLSKELEKTRGCSRQNVKEILNSLEKKQFIRLETDFLKYLYKGISKDEVNSAYSIDRR